MMWPTAHRGQSLKLYSNKHGKLMSGSSSTLPADTSPCSVHFSLNDRENINGVRKIRSLEVSLSPKRRRVFMKRKMGDQKPNLSARPLPLQRSTKPLKSPAFSSPVSSLLLRPCHICHRRPTTRAVLCGYLDCEDCGKRTCFICMRECENEGCRYAELAEAGAAVNSLEYHQRPHSRLTRICSYCSVETIDSAGQDTVTCLDCHLYQSELNVLLSHPGAADDRSSSSMVFDAVSDRF